MNNKCRLKEIRKENNYTQTYVAQYLNCNRSTYANYETEDIILPLEYADKLSILYNVKISYLLGIDDKKKINKKIKSMDYNYLLENLNKLKKENKHKFKYISNFIGVTEASICRYFNGKIEIPLDKLVLLCDFYSCNIDKLLNKI